MATDVEGLTVLGIMEKYQMSKAAVKTRLEGVKPIGAQQTGRQGRPPFVYALTDVRSLFEVKQE